MFFLFFLAIIALGQQQEPKLQGKPEVRLNYLNVCTPSPDEQAVLRAALLKISSKPAFSPDFEISRGRTTLQDATGSKFVRLRRDFAPESPWLTAQYSMSTDPQNTIETLVLRLRDTKDFHEISMEDRVSTEAAAPVTVLAADTPPVRMRIERLGKGAVALARCPNVDQSAYEPLFKQAAETMARYREALGMRTAFRSDIEWLGRQTKPKPRAAK
ncbi:MAG TPA: hypothetical protein VG649_20570 [Candidatus Angelobacter sp.]|jgi:hypothetical protein|nr:hypothetical protein [Candidatus Angelobacter sp.]